MSSHPKSVFIILFLIIISGTGVASDFEFLNVELFSTEWGSQTVLVNLAYHGEFHTFVSGKTSVRYEGDKVRVPRWNRANALMAPGDTIQLKMVLDVPGNFGRGTAVVSIYDVVDTLDALLESHKIYSKEFNFEVEIPANLKAVLDSGVQHPVFADYGQDLNEQFSQLILIFLHRGMSLDEIAQELGVRTDKVRKQVLQLAGAGYVTRSEDIFIPSIAVLGADKIESLMPEIENTAGAIYSTVKSNLDSYDDEIARMVKFGELTSDPNDLMDPGSVLHHKYPTLYGLALWDRVIPVFIYNKERLEEDEMPDVQDMLFMVSGHIEDLNDHFCVYRNDKIGRSMICGNVNEPLRQHLKFNPKSSIVRGVSFGQGNFPVYYTYSPDKVSSAVNVLLEGSWLAIEGLRDKTDAAFSNLDKSHLHAARYAIWALVVDQVMEMVNENNLMEKEGTGIYVFQNLES